MTGRELIANWKRTANIPDLPYQETDRLAIVIDQELGHLQAQTRLAEAQALLEYLPMSFDLAPGSTRVCVNFITREEAERFQDWLAALPALQAAREPDREGSRTGETFPPPKSKNLLLKKKGRKRK